MDHKLLKKIQKLAIAALVSDETLMGSIVLKGGNAIDIAYDIHNRGSIDIDFSMSGELSGYEFEKVAGQAKHLLEKEFLKEGLKIFDFDFYKRPEKIAEEVQDFWGGYKLEFKIIEIEKYNSFEGDQDSLRRNAVVVNSNSSTRFCIDISKFEYVEKKVKRDIDGAVVNVYSPEMIVLEKLRALCQQVDEYKEIVKSVTSKSRARDFYDIYNMIHAFNIDFESDENIDLAQNIFASKRVPMNYIDKLNEYRELHRQSWSSVIDTVDPNETLKAFDEYFDFVVEKFRHLSKK